MQKNRMILIENAIFIGIITILLLVFVSVLGQDINAHAVNDGTVQVKSSHFYWEASILTIGVLTFVILTLNSLFQRSNVNSEEEEKLKNFIINCEQRGYSKDEIIGLLSNRGWKERELDKYF